MINLSYHFKLQSLTPFHDINVVYFFMEIFLGFSFKCRTKNHKIILDFGLSLCRKLGPLSATFWGTFDRVSLFDSLNHQELALQILQIL